MSSMGDLMLSDVLETLEKVSEYSSQQAAALERIADALESLNTTLMNISNYGLPPAR